MPKVTIVGAGNVGATAAHIIASKNLADVVLVDVAEGLSLIHILENGLVVDAGTPHYIFDETDNARIKSFLSKIL